MQIWVPDSATEAKPRFQCRMCNDRFVTLPAYEQHVVKCANVHEDLIQQARLWHRELNEVPDPEWEAYNAAIRNEGRDPEEQYNRGRKSNIRRASES